MAAEDLYGDQSAPEPAGAPAEEKEDKGTKTALIDSDICPGMEPGDEMVVKIEKVMDKQYLVSYAPEPGKEEPKTEEAASAPPEPEPGSMGAMMG